MKRRRRTLCTVARRLVLGLLMLAVLLVGAVAFLLGTEPGARTVMWTVTKVVPGEAAVARVEGTFLGHLRLGSMTYSRRGVEVAVDALVLDWAPRALGRRVLHLHELTVESPHIQLQPDAFEPGAEAPSDEPLTLPDLQLPLALRLEQIQINSLEVVPAPDASPLRLRKLSASADWEGNQIQLHSLSLLDAGVEDVVGSFEATGDLEPRGPYPLHLNTTLRAEVPDAFSGTLTGRIAGALKDSISMVQRLDGDAQADLDVSARNPLSDLGWDATLRVLRLPEQHVPPAVAHAIHAEVTSQGSLERADIQVTVRLPAPSVELPPPSVDVSAEINLDTLRFALNGSWQQVQWPLTGEPMVGVPVGALCVVGDPDAYTITMNTQLAGPHIPESRWMLEAVGSTERVALSSVHADILEGTLDLVAEASWSPTVAWDARLQVADINPGAMATNMPGSLHLVVHTTGALEGEALSAQATIEELGGHVRDLPLQGRGRVEISPERLVLDDIGLTLQSARVEVRGVLEDALAVDWGLQVDDLSALLPDALGQIRAEGSVRGSAKKPETSGRLDVQGVAFRTIKIPSALAAFDLGLDPDYASQARIQVPRIEVGEQAVTDLMVGLEGTLPAHHVTMRATHPDVALTFGARGSLDAANASWKGSIEQVDLSAGRYGSWTLEAPCGVTLSGESQRLEPLRMTDQGAEISIAADWSPADGQARVNIADLSFNRFAPLLPPGILEAEGVVQLGAAADLRDDVLTAHLQVEIEPGQITVAPPDADAVSLLHQDGRIRVDYGSEKVKASAQWDLDALSLALNVEVPREALLSNPLNAAITGDVTLAAADFDRLSAFVPAVQPETAALDLHLAIAGTLGDPAVRGHIALQADRLVIPPAGLSLEGIRVRLEGTNAEVLTLNGRLRSGPGWLAVRGETVLDPAQGFPVSLTLQGEQFQVANLPEARVQVSPNLEVTANQESVQVRGEVGIPTAEIVLDEIPAGAQGVSGDERIVDGTHEGIEATHAGPGVDAEVTVALGESVRFEGMGLKAELAGEITATQRPGKVPTASGELKITSGSYRAFGQDLIIGPGRVSFAGGAVDNPNINIVAGRDIQGTKVGILATGTAKEPRIATFASDPSLSEADRVSMLLTGQTVSDLASGRVYAGKEITEKLSIGMYAGGDEKGREFVTRYRMWNDLHIEGTSSAQRSGIRFTYDWEFE